MLINRNETKRTTATNKTTSVEVNTEWQIVAVINCPIQNWYVERLRNFTRSWPDGQFSQCRKFESFWVVNWNDFHVQTICLYAQMMKPYCSNEWLSVCLLPVPIWKHVRRIIYGYSLGYGLFLAVFAFFHSLTTAFFVSVALSFGWPWKHHTI